MVLTRWSGTRKYSFHRMKRCSFWFRSFDTWSWRAEYLAIGLYASNRPQCCRSTFSLEPHSGCCVMKVYLVPIISPSKYVVRLGWSSVKPVDVLVYKPYAGTAEMCAHL